MTENRDHCPEAGYETHEHTLRSDDVHELMQSTADRDRRDNQFNNNVSGPGAGGRWDPDTEIELTPEDTLGLASGVGLGYRAAGTITLFSILFALLAEDFGRRLVRGRLAASSEPTHLARRANVFDDHLAVLGLPEQHLPGGLDPELLAEPLRW